MNIFKKFVYCEEDIVKSVKDFFNKYNFMLKGVIIIVGVFGGLDLMVFFYVLYMLCGCLVNIIVVYVDYWFRGVEFEEDMCFV